jgi:hypothetical protein
MHPAPRKAETVVSYADLCEKIAKNHLCHAGYLALDSRHTDGYNTPCAAKNRHNPAHMAA